MTHIGKADPHSQGDVASSPWKQAEEVAAQPSGPLDGLVIETQEQQVLQDLHREQQGRLNRCAVVAKGGRLTGQLTEPTEEQLPVALGVREEPPVPLEPLRPKLQGT